MRDHAYDRIPYRAPQMEHHYGPNVHIIADPLALTQLARLCAKGTYQPEINTLVAVLYRDLLRVIVNSEFPRRPTATATGVSMCTAIDAYKRDVIGKPRKVIAVNLIVTPEYLKNVTSAHPEAIVYALRLDRGLSPEDVFDSVPGTHWDRERGLDDKQYIVPGGGGFGEIMNNAYV